MMGTVCRVIMRQIPPPCYKMAKGFPSVYPIHFPTAVCLSSSCINRRRINYGSTGKLDVDQTEEYEQYAVPESRHSRQSSKRVGARGRTEYTSDDETSDDSTDDENSNFSFIKLPRKSSAARLEMDQCTVGYLKEHDLYLVKKVRSVQRVLNSGMLPKKIFFTRTNDLARLNSDLKGVKLFKIHECDALSGMQGKAEPPFFAVCERHALPVASPDAPTIESIPLAVAYGNIKNLSILCDVLEAAVMCGCKQLLFKPSYDSLFSDYYTLRKAQPILQRIPVKFHQDWDMIRERFDSDASFYLLSLTDPKDSDCDLPQVSLHEVDFWKSKEVVLILTYSITNKLMQLCESKKAQVIRVNGANEITDLGSTAVGAVTFEIWRQWNARSKPKPKTKVNKRI